MKRQPPPLDLKSQMDELRQENVIRRLWNKEPSLWKSDPAVHQSIRHRLGWLDLPSFMADAQGELRRFVTDIKKSGFKEVVLLGMGGSSLCPEVLRLTFGTKPGFLRLHVLDTTDPGAIAAVDKKINLKKTLFLMSSKSGGTIEVVSLFKYFWARLEKSVGKNPGRHFVAITDPDTSLGTLAKEKKFRNIFLSRSDVGGRFSALTFFGLVPAALIGLDIQKLLDRALHMADICGPDVPAEDNPGLLLGAWLAAGKEVGRDKMTLVTSPELGSFGLWVEQLIAESTGKDGSGILPVESEALARPESYGRDRLFVYVRLKKSKKARRDLLLDALEKRGHPVFRIELNDSYDLAGEFFRWEMATAVAGQILGINPFDEPNVSESKANTLKVLARFEADKVLPETPPLLQEKNMKAWRLPAPAKASGLSPLINSFLAAKKAGDYLAIMAYVTPSPSHHAALQKFRNKIGQATGLATTLGYGPRFLHSTGQLHKGGGGNGLFIQITSDDARDLEIPGSVTRFGILKRAQALGDMLALRNHKRRTLRFHLTKSVPRDLARLTSLVKI
jgi:glucose-6-phosphate isomerase